MLTLTKMYRANIIDHVMPSDLDKNDIKHGLYLKEKMLAEMTDDHVKELNPDWKEKERYYKKHGLSDYMEKIFCGEMELDEVPKPKIAQFECWLRHKPYDPNDNCLDDYDYHCEDPNCSVEDKNPLNDGYCEWIKPNKLGVFEFMDLKDEVFQMQIAIIGENAGKYFPYQDYTHSSGWEYVSNDILQYDFENGMDEEFFRLFFRLRKGYQHYSWTYENTEWNNANYPGKEVRTIMCDPFRIKYTDTSDSGTVALLTGKQWLRVRYPVDMIGVSVFTIKIDNLKPTEE